MYGGVALCLRGLWEFSWDRTSVMNRGAGYRFRGGCGTVCRCPVEPRSRWSLSWCIERSGPLRPDLIRAVLDYHGLTGQPAVTPHETAKRCGITVGMLTVRAKKVRAAGAAAPLRPDVVTAAIAGQHPRR